MKAARVALTWIIAIALLTSTFVSSASLTAEPPGPIAEPSGETSIVRVYYPDLATGNKILISFEPQLLETNYEQGYHILQVIQEDIDRLLALGLRVEADTTWVAPPVRPLADASIQSIPGYSCYRTVEETFAAAQALATNYPTLVTWIDAGDSWQKTVNQGGYDIMVLKLTNSAIGGDKPKLFVNAAVHAREYATAELAIRFGEYLANNYSLDADVTWLLDYHEVHLLLFLNPDGRKKAETGLLWRKNTNNNYCANTSSRGADLNRNYSFQWGCCGGSSGSQCDETYRGPSAASEPETQAIQNYVATLFPDQRGPNLTDPAPSDATGIWIDLQAYGQLVLWPWGFTSTVPPNGTQLQTLGRKMAYFNGHTPEQGIGLYVTDGSVKDYGYGTMGVASYTFELGTAFFQSCSYFEGILWPANLPALLYAAKVARTPYMTPAGPDALSLTPSASEVPAGTGVTLSATIIDTRYNNTNGTEATQNIAAAEYYVDVPPWNGGSPYTMAASDGSFNSTVEAVSASADTTGWTTGRHILYVRGKDANNNWGAFSAIFLTISGPPTQPPTANDQPSVSTPEDIPVSITLTGSDPEGAPLTFIIVTGPRHGTLTGTGAVKTYTPDMDYNGTDSFTFVANDGQLNSAPATVTITITPVADPPMANPDSVTTAQNTAVGITLTGHDPDGDSLTFSIGTDASHGTLIGDPPSLTYTPATGYTGPDAFTFTVSDGTATSDPALVSITVNPPGPVTVFFDNFEADLGWTRNPSGSDTATLGLWERANPEAVDYYGTKQMGTTVSGSYDLVTGPLAGSSAGSYDLDGGVTTIRSPDIALPGGGELALSFSYYLAHYSNSSTADYLRVKVVGSTTGTIFEELGAADDDDAAWASFSGSLDAFAGQTVYLFIEAGDTGTASLVEAAVDDVLIIATNSNQTPTANPQSVSTAEDTAIGITLTGFDPEGHALTYSVVSGPGHGDLSGTAPDLTYTPALNYNGNDSFTFKVNDGTVDSTAAMVSITISPLNDAPVANPQSATVQQDTPKTITLVGTDVDGDPLTYAIVSQPTKGALSGTAPNVTYTPYANQSGADSFTFKVNDGTVDSSSATVSITVTPVNHAPVADPQSVTTAEDVAVGITLTGSDSDAGDVLTFSVLSDPSHGTLSGTAPGLTYTPAANYNGADSFTFVANDGQLNSAAATVDITVNAVNDVPVANAQSVTTQQDTALAITLTGSDVEGDTLTFAVAANPSHGTLSGTAPTLTYTPATGYSGADSFTFTAHDGAETSGPATVSITVTPAGDTVWLSLTANASLGSLGTANDEDIVALNLATGVYTWVFDGSDVGITTDIDAFDVLSNGHILMSFDVSTSVAGIGTVTDADIVEFTPTSLGATTAGTFTWKFDASDVGLSTTYEDVDALYMMSDGTMLVSTRDPFSVTGISGQDEDLIRFTATAWGSTTAGTWSWYFDGSDVGLSTNSKEDVDALWVDEGITPYPDVYLSTIGNFSVTGVSGANEDVFVFHPTALDSTTAGTFGPGRYLDGSLFGLNAYDVDAFDVRR